MTAAKKQKFTPELARILRQRERNSAAIVKLTSAQEYLHDFALHSEVLEQLQFAFVQERRNLSLALREELRRQGVWE